MLNFKIHKPTSKNRLRLKLPHYYLPIVIFFFIFTQSAFSQESISISHPLYHKYEGNYKLPNGRFITGGLMDEIEGHMVFLEPLKISTGGLFKPITKTKFQSLPPDSIQIRFALNNDGSIKGIWWEGKNKDPIFAKKINTYTIENIQFTNGKVTLSGELRLPKTKGPHPLIINVHGSGKVTRHMGPWNTFFLHYGVGTLSYDKRGAGKSTGDFATSGYKDFASDLLAAIDFAQQHPRIDTSKIGLHGSSEGGWVSAITASQTEELAFMIIRAGSGVSGSETYIHEIKNELKEYELTEQEYREAVKFERHIQYMVNEDYSLQKANRYIDSLRSREWFVKVYDDWNGISKNRWVKMKKTGPVDPAVYLRKLANIPILWFLAQEDENVPYELSKPRIKGALEDAGNNNFEIVTIPEANHAFFVTTDNSSKKYTDKYWGKMVSWLRKYDIIKE